MGFQIHQPLRVLCMAKRRRMYKQTKVKTKSVGSAGGQILLGTVEKIDPQMSANGYLNNIRLSCLLNSPESIHTHGQGGFIAYLTTDNSWDDSNIITARAGNFADTVNMPAKRTLRQNSDNTLGNMGLVHLWIEITDISITEEDVRVVVETWGSFIKFEFA